MPVSAPFARATRSSIVLGVGAAAALALSGCAGQTVPMTPAPGAQAVECAQVSVSLPKQVAGLDTRYTNAQATGAWGNPARVLLRCGMPALQPTTNRCLNVNGIDWVEDASQAPSYRYQTYGRNPAVEVTIDTSGEPHISGTTALVDLTGAVSRIPTTRGCVGAVDLLAPPSATPGTKPGATPGTTLGATPATSPSPR